MKAAPAVGFEYHTSRILVVATIVVGLLAIIAVWISGVSWWPRMILMLFVAALGGMSLGRMLRPRVRSLLWRSDGGVDLSLHDTLTDGRREVQASMRNARVMGPLIVLTLRWPPREHASLWLLPDNLDADTHRRLRMRLGTRHEGFSSGNPDRG